MSITIRCGGYLRYFGNVSRQACAIYGSERKPDGLRYPEK